MIRKLTLENFKSLDKLELNLGDFNVFVGANAAGKSNILQAFKFISDVSIHGLQNAVAIQGGFKFLRNVRSSRKDVVIEALVESEEQFFLPLLSDKQPELQTFTMCTAKKIVHRLVLESEGDTFFLSEDKFICDFVLAEPDFEDIEGTLTASHLGSEIISKVELDSDKVRIEPGMLRFLGNQINFPKNAALAFSAQPFIALSIPNPSAGSRDLDIAYYDFDPRLSKQAVRITGSSDLEESADNLAVVIQTILADQKQKDRLFERIRDLLPYVRTLDLEHFSDSSLLMSMRERYKSDFVFPASLISNGTVSIIATLVAVLFQSSSIVIMEEPERNIHPYLIERLLNTIKEASQRKQILISTHSPVVLDNCDLASLFLVRRDEEGTSQVTQPKDSDIVSAFLNEDFGIGRLYATRLLEM